MIASSLQFGMDRVSSPKSTDISAVPSIPNILRNTMRGVIMKRCPLLDVKLIPLSQGYYAIVDTEDFDRINQHNWHVCNLPGRILYAIRGGEGTTLRMHREVISTPKGMLTDHINHNSLDNRKCNLRICTSAQNLANTRNCRGGSSKYKGVHFSKERKRWRAQIRFNHKAKSLGYFDDESDAAKAYDAKAIEVFGEFALTNF